MIHYDDDARVTLGEFCAWAEQTPAYVREAEAKGIISRDENGLFEVGPTIAALADLAEAELADLQAKYVPTWKGVWAAYGRMLAQLGTWFEYVVIKRGVILPMLRGLVRMKRSGFWPW